MPKLKPGRIASRSPRALPPWGLGYKSGEELARLMSKEISGDPKLYAESFEHAREAFPPDSLVSRDGVARVIETMRAFDAVPAGMKMAPERVYDNRFVLKALGR